MKLLNKTIICALFITFVSGPAFARIVCWTNKDGVKECGDHVPPEYSQKSTQEMNDQGMVIDEKARAKTDAEIAEEKKQQEIQAEKDRVAAEAKKRDMILLSTFSSVDDINLARDGKITAIDSAIGLANKRKEKFQSDLDKYIKQAAEQERSGKPASEELQNDIDSTRRQLKSNDEFIAEKEAEKEQVTKDAEADVARFKELKGIK